jgi:phage-related protein
MSNIIITLTGANNDSIVFDESNEDYVVAKGLTGFGMTDLNVRIDEGAGDGGRFISTRTITRSITMPIYILGSDRDDVENKYRDLAKILDNKNGAIKITAEYADSSEWVIEGYRVGGGDVTYGNDSGITYLYTVIEIRAPYPYWKKVAENTFSSLSNYTINNTGDVDTYVKWEIRGPMSGVVLSNANGTLNYASAIAAGETLIIDTENALVYSNLLPNAYGNLSGIPKMFKIPVGSSTITITPTGAGGGSSILGKWNERREVIF